MTIELLISLLGAVALLVTGAWALVKIVVAQFEKRLDERFSVMEEARKEGRRLFDERFSRMETTYRQLESDFVNLRLELPKEYVRRDDHIRFETVITAKLDAVAAKIDLAAERQRRD